ncbi:MAG: glycosyltransferase family 39 protein [Candidatus Curtissbacteria bacterium]|nr:glycosyltransferase family 39 protein [Candidatus Curtissbacteria bacterium]
MIFKPSIRLLLPLSLLSHLILLFFTRFTLWPEMVVYPYLLNHGFLLYRDIINPYPPLLAFKLSIFATIFGYQPAPYQILAWLLILITDVAIFLAAAKITKSPKKALAVTLFFIVLSIPFGVNGLWYDLVQTPFIIVAVYFFGRYLEKKIDNVDLLVSAVSLAVAFFIKQQALWLILWFLAVLVYRKWKDKKNLLRAVFIMVAPILIGLGLEILYVVQKGIFQDFVTWTVYLPFFKASQMPGYVLLPTLRQAATVALLFLIFTPVVLKRNFPQIFYLSTAVVLLLFAYPRFDFFHLIPSLSILALVFALSINDFQKQKSLGAIISLGALVFFSLVTASYLKSNWTREVRFFEKDVSKAADVLQKVNPKGKPIFLQNVSGQILVISQTLPTKPWADSFPWYLEMPAVQANIIGGILNEKPDIVVYKPYTGMGKYQIASYRPQKVADFLDQNYKEVLKIDGNLQLKARLFK